MRDRAATAQPPDEEWPWADRPPSSGWLTARARPEDVFPLEVWRRSWKSGRPTAALRAMAKGASDVG